MAEEGRQQSWISYLDKEKENVLLARYVFTSDFKEIEEFAVIYLSNIGGKLVEIARYDCSQREAVNVHKFYCEPPKKIFLNKQKSFETMAGFIEDVEKNWQIFLSRFLEK